MDKKHSSLSFFFLFPPFSFSLALTRARSLSLSLSFFLSAPRTTRSSTRISHVWNCWSDLRWPIKYLTRNRVYIFIGGVDKSGNRLIIYQREWDDTRWKWNKSKAIIHNTIRNASFSHSSSINFVGIKLFV